jgi:hypothetical protein
MSKRVFEKQFLKDVLWDEAEGAKKVNDEVTGKRRWSIDHFLVFSFEGRLWGVCYSVGATEQQDETPFEYDPDEIECQEMKAVEVTVTKYQPVKDDE